MRRYTDRYEEEGLAALEDKRLEQVSHHRAPVDEVLAMEVLYGALRRLERAALP